MGKLIGEFNNIQVVSEDGGKTWKPMYGGDATGVHKQRGGGLNEAGAVADTVLRGYGLSLPAAAAAGLKAVGEKAFPYLPDTIFGDVIESPEKAFKDVTLQNDGLGPIRQPDTGAGQVLADVIGSAGTGVVMPGAGTFLQKLGYNAIGGLGGGLAAQMADSPIGKVIMAMLGSGSAIGAVEGLRKGGQEVAAHAGQLVGADVMSPSTEYRMINATRDLSPADIALMDRGTKEATSRGATILPIQAVPRETELGNLTENISAKATTQGRLRKLLEDQSPAVQQIVLAELDRTALPAGDNIELVQRLIDAANKEVSQSRRLTTMGQRPWYSMDHLVEGAGETPVVRPGETLPDLENGLPIQSSILHGTKDGEQFMGALDPEYGLTADTMDELLQSLTHRPLNVLPTDSKGMPVPPTTDILDAPSQVTQMPAGGQALGEQPTPLPNLGVERPRVPGVFNPQTGDMLTPQGLDEIRVGIRAELSRINPNSPGASILNGVLKQLEDTQGILKEPDRLNAMFLQAKEAVPDYKPLKLGPKEAMKANALGGLNVLEDWLGRLQANREVGKESTKNLLGIFESEKDYPTAVIASLKGTYGPQKLDKVLGILNNDTYMQPETIGRLADDIAKTDKAAFPQMVRLDWQKKLDAAMKTETPGKAIHESLWGTEGSALRENTKAKVAAIARINGVPERAAVDGFSRLMDLMEATGRYQGGVSRMVERAGGVPAVRMAEAGAVAAGQGTNRIIMAIRDLTLGLSDKQIAEIVATPEGIKKIADFAKFNWKDYRAVLKSAITNQTLVQGAKAQGED